METVGQVIGIFSGAVTVVGATFAVIRAILKKRLSAEERELLVEAAGNGEIYVYSAAQAPVDWVRVGGRDFDGDGDPVIGTMYLEAFRSLCRRGYIVNDSGTRFSLTWAGFEKARKLRAKK